MAPSHLVDRRPQLHLAFLGNLVSAAVFVAGAYCHLYGREPQTAAGNGEPRLAREGETTIIRPY